MLCDHNRDRATTLAHSLGDQAQVVKDLRNSAVRGVILAMGGSDHFALAQSFVDQHRFVVSVADSIDDVRLLLSLDDAAKRAGVPVLVGAGFAPGLTCLLAQLGASWFDQVDEVHVAKVGAGGPACARQHHKAFRGTALDWRDGAWLRRRGGSGRELCWFPDPVGGRDCYRAAMSDTILQALAFPEATRVTSRMAATRRDRLTMHLPMLRPPHADGGMGAVRVELRGRRNGGRDVVVLGAIDRPAVGSAIVAAQSAIWILEGRIDAGSSGLAHRVDPRQFLRGLAERGVRAAVFDGTPRTFPDVLPT